MQRFSICAIACALVTTEAVGQESARDAAGGVAVEIPRGWTQTLVGRGGKVWLESVAEGARISVSPEVAEPDAFELVAQNEARGVRARNVRLSEERGRKNTRIEWDLSNAFVVDVLVPRGDGSDAACQVRLEIQGTPDADRIARCDRALTAVLSSLELNSKDARPSDAAPDRPDAAPDPSTRDETGVVAAMKKARREDLAIWREPASSGSPLLGETAPDFSLPGLDGAVRSFRELSRGKITLLTFFGAGCAACRDEIPRLAALQRSLGSDAVLLVAVNAWDEPPDAVRAFAEKAGLDGPILLRGNAVASRVFGVESLPATLIIDERGKVLSFDAGSGEAASAAREQRVRAMIETR